MANRPVPGHADTHHKPVTFGLRSNKMIPVQISVTVNLNGLRGELQRSLQRAIYLVACGLHASEHITGDILRLPDEAFQMVYTNYLKWTDVEAKNGFSEWVLLNGFREVIESVTGFLESAHKVLSCWDLAEKQQGGVLITGTEWNETFNIGGNKFHRLGFPDKLAHLIKEHKIAISENEERRIFSVNAARNCLVHRNGVVSHRDVTDNNELVVHWMRMALLLKNEDGESELVIGQVVEKDSVIAIRNTTSEKRFKLGEQIHINVKEFSEIAWSVFLFGEHIVTRINEYGVQHGFLPTQEANKSCTN
jgi:hypothetical protein